MSNKRRKRIGSQKIARNLAIRIRRGAVKAGNPLPGHSWIYTTAIDATYAGRGAATRDEHAALTDDYWRGA